MKKIITGSIIATSLALGGCATSRPIGSFYTKLDLPIAVTSSNTSSRTGVATCKSILGLVATGDCSLETAMKNGNITQVNHVDWKVNNILGIGNYKLVVYGN